MPHVSPDRADKRWANRLEKQFVKESNSYGSLVREYRQLRPVLESLEAPFTALDAMRDVSAAHLTGIELNKFAVRRSRPMVRVARARWRLEYLASLLEGAIYRHPDRPNARPIPDPANRAKSWDAYWKWLEHFKREIAALPEDEFV